MKITGWQYREDDMRFSAVLEGADDCKMDHEAWFKTFPFSDRVPELKAEIATRVLAEHEEHCR